MTPAVGREHIECDAPNCGKPNPSARCARCQTVFYCDATCQRAHWKEHKPDCRSLKWMREQMAGIGSTTASNSNSNSNNNNDNDNDNDIGNSNDNDNVENEEELCCYICHTEPPDDPYYVPGCNHAFCFSCLRKWQSYVARDQSTMTAQRCPACRAEAPDLERSITDTAMLYASRANSAGLDDHKKEEYHRLALAELDRISDSDNPATKFQMFCTKSEILIALNRPAEALEFMEQIAIMDQQGRDNHAQIEDLLPQLDAAMDQGRENDIQAIMDQMEVLKTKHHHLTNNNKIDNYLSIAETKEKLEDWDGAMETYKWNVMNIMEYDSNGRPSNFTPIHQRRMYMGMSRCLYYKGDYEMALELGEAAIEMNRHFPQVHKYVALCQKAMGNLEAAIQTMSRAVHYETPWDDANKREVLAMYNEFKNVES